MSSPIQRWFDRLLGRGTAAITVPIMDGAIKPNRALDEAAVVLNLPGIDDIASDGHHLWISAGAVLYRLDGQEAVEVRRFDAPITALAADAKGHLAIALGGRELRLIDANGATVAQTRALAGRALHSANALAFEGVDSLLVSDGSEQFGTEQWCHDLMQHGKTGKVGRWNWQSGDSTLLAGARQWCGAARHRGRTAGLPLAHGAGPGRRFLADLLCLPHPTGGICAARRRVPQAHDARGASQPMGGAGLVFRQEFSRTPARRRGQDHGRAQALGAAALVRTGFARGR
jgi:hypothetical protein